jgi:predicted RNA binding protein YcfA (HicA-like mRNA interferase family)
MVFKPMKRSDLIRKLRKAGCVTLRNTGGHEIYQCPCGSHAAPVPHHNEITAGVVNSIGNQMACLPKGWLK